MVHGLVDAVAAHGEPVVDAAEGGRQDAAFDAGFLGDLTYGSFLVVLATFGMALREAPLKPATPIKAGDNRNPEFAVGRVYYNATG